MHKCHDWGLLVIRLAPGIAFFAHGIVKFMDMQTTVGFFASLALPAFVAYLVAAVETLGGLALILGAYTKWVGYALAVVMLVAIVYVKWMKFKTGFFGGWELDFVLLFSVVGIALAGPGAFAVQKKTMM